MRASSRSICRAPFSWYGRYRSRAPLRGAAEEGELRLPLRHRVVREAVAEVVEGELQALRERLGVPRRSGRSAKARPSGGRLEVTLGVLGEETARRWRGCASRRMHVSTSRSARPLAAAWRTPLVRSREGQARSGVEERVVQASCSLRRCPLPRRARHGRADGLHEPGNPSVLSAPAAGRRAARPVPARSSTPAGEEPLDEALQHLQPERPSPSGRRSSSA